MRVLIFLISFLLLSFQIKEFAQVERTLIEGKNYYWESEKQNISNKEKVVCQDTEKSFIKFENDSVFIVNYLCDISEGCSLSIGTYKFINKKSLIEININDYILFSGNVIQIHEYTKKLNRLTKLKLTDENNLKMGSNENERFYLPIDTSIEKSTITFPDGYFKMLMYLRANYEK